MENRKESPEEYKKRLKNWIETHPNDWKKIKGEQYISELEYVFIRRELNSQGFSRLENLLIKAYSIQ